MIRRYWIVTCDYCGREYRFNGSTKPTDAELREAGLTVSGLSVHLCEKCRDDYFHDKNVKRAGNLKQFQPGKKFNRE